MTGNFGEILMIKMLKIFELFTEIETNELNNICEKEKDINKLKILLANEATKILHGAVASKKAEQTAKDTFGKKGLSLNLPVIKVKLNDVNAGIDLLNFLTSNKIMSSKNEVRRAILNKGLRINDQILDNNKKFLDLKDFKEKISKISLEKKDTILLKLFNFIILIYNFLNKSWC